MVLNHLPEIVQAAVTGAFAGYYIINKMKINSGANKKDALDYAVAVMEEGIAYAEEEMKILKREAAHNAGVGLKKLPVEDTKDAIKFDKFFTDALRPVREMTHDKARKYILENVSKLSDPKIKVLVQKMINVNTIDLAIKLRIIAAKIQIVDPLKPYFYKFI